MTRALTLSLLLALLPPLSAAFAVEGSSQAIGEMRYDTPNYQLVVWSAGHFALKVGGSWMPGCVCLNLGGAAQYQSDKLSYLESTVQSLPEGRQLTVTGRLTPALQFTQTLRCVPDSVTLTYAVRALADLPQADLRITASPQTDQVKGKTLSLRTAAGQQEVVWPPAAPQSVRDVTSLAWPDLGRRDARTVFVACAASQVALSEKSAVYTAWLRAPGPMQQGETAEATLRFEAITRGDAASTVASLSGSLGLTRFNVNGGNGLVHNVRTDRGLLIQQLSINEQDVHQVSVGRGKAAPWGGVHVTRQEPGRGYATEATGQIVNTWAERLEARSTPDRDELHLTAQRDLQQGEQRLRLLMYVAQWLEQERTPFYIRTPDGKTQGEDRGESLWFGMPPASNEAGLGPYRPLGRFPAGTEIVVPMLARGEQLTVRVNTPTEISGFRFEIYFRGLWFQAVDNKARDLDLLVTVEKLPQRRVGTLTVAEDARSGAVQLSSGGLPLLDGVVLRDKGGETLRGAWSWATLADGGRGTATVRATTAEMRLPEYLFGKRPSILDRNGKVDTGPAATALRLGADLPPLDLPAGSTVEFAPSALERVALTVGAAAQLRLQCETPGLARLLLAAKRDDLRLSVAHRQVRRPSPDALTARALPQGSDPGVYGGLQVKRDAPGKGDVTVSTPWWEVVHAAAQGGAVTSVRFLNGSGANILREPIRTVFASGTWYSEVNERHATLKLEQVGPAYLKLTVRGELRDSAQQTLCPYTHVYEYRPMLVRRTCTYEIGAKPVVCNGLSVGSLSLASWLDEAAWRHLDERTTWGHAVFPGPNPVEYRDFSQYLCLFKRGVEGIDWVPAADLAQWWGFAGATDCARYGILGDSKGPRLAIEPYALGSAARPLSGTLRFDSYLSLPQTRRCLPRRNFVACLSNGECRPEMLKQCAEYGVTDILLGCGNNPGSFELSDLKASQQTVQEAAKYGIKVYPFDPFQLVNRRAPLWQQHGTMAMQALRNGKPEPREYSDYGDYFCVTSEAFRQALQAGYRKLVDSASFGGLYHDFVHPYTCYSTAHYPAPHLNTDGVLDMVLWDREFLGKDRVFCGHTGWVPVLFFQDLCTVTAIFEEYPATEPLPLHLTPAQGEFVNAAQRTLVSSFLATGAGAPGEDNPVPPAALVDAYLSRCALVGIFPWAHAGFCGARDSYDLQEKIRPWLRLFSLRGKSDLGTMQFLPYYRQTAVLSDNPGVRAATYWNGQQAIVVLANSESAEAAAFTVQVRPEHFGWPAGSTLVLTPTKDSVPLTAGKGNEFQGTLAGFGWSAYEVNRK